MCPPPSGATIVRMAPARECPSYNLGRNFTEGMGVLFKENIAPYKFKAHIYYKDIIVTTTWSGSTYAQITNQYTDRAPVSVEEIINLIDKKGKCLSKAEYLRSNREVTAFDQDLDPEEVKLKPSKFNTNGSRGWHTTKETHVAIGSPGIYRTGTTVNCIVEEVDGRSTYPYDSFALSTGHILFMSPFFGLNTEARTEHNSYSMKRFRQVESYKIRDLDTNAESQPVTRNFLTTEHITVAWNWVPKQKSVCSLTKWREVEEMIRDSTEDSYRFTAKSMASTFIGNSVPLNLDQVHLSQCVTTDAKAALDAMYQRRYNRTHVRVGSMETYLVRGGFILAFQPIISNELAALYVQELARTNATALLRAQARTAHTRTRRAPRAAGSTPKPGKGAATAASNYIQITSVSSAEFAALQFAYDRIQQHVNEMFARIATAWCQLQNKEQTLWREAAALNPSAVASAMLEKRTSARLLGDVMAVSHCASLAGRNVFIQNSMRDIFRPGTCYSRPLVSFSYRNDTEPIEGQLGTHNELLIERTLLEPCAINQRRYFLFGHSYVYYENYTYVRTVPTAEVETISAYVELNLTMLEDHEFLPAEVYTRAELADTGLLDYVEIQRRNQLHSLKFFDIDKVVKVDHNLQIMRGMANFFQGLGDVGQAVGKVVLGAAGAVLSTVTGIASFLSNPFGALAIGLLVVAGLVAAFLAYRYVMRLKANPMKALYPVTTRALKDEAKGKSSPGTDSEKGGTGEDDIDEDKLALAQEMIKYMTIVSSLEQAEHKAKKKNRGPALISSHAVNKLLRRRRTSPPPKYDAVPTAPPDNLF